VGPEEGGDKRKRKEEKGPAGGALGTLVLLRDKKKAGKKSIGKKREGRDFGQPLIWIEEGGDSAKKKKKRRKNKRPFQNIGKGYLLWECDKTLPSFGKRMPQRSEKKVREEDPQGGKKGTF